MPMDKTIKVSNDVLEKLRILKRYLEREKGRRVTYSEIIEMLLDWFLKEEKEKMKVLKEALKDKKR